MADERPGPALAGERGPRPPHARGPGARETCPHVGTVLRRGDGFSLLECALLSGYTHQIRAHLYYAGLGILGDTLYRPKGVDVFDARLQAARLMLHAYEISFAHPGKGTELNFQAPYPLDFEQKLASL
jgi:23S rRNA pseudouridine1911/1915/1917 synthase